jgi:hypothetical protein
MSIRAPYTAGTLSAPSRHASSSGARFSIVAKVFLTGSPQTNGHRFAPQDAARGSQLSSTLRTGIGNIERQRSQSTTGRPHDKGTNNSNYTTTQ